MCTKSVDRYAPNSRKSTLFLRTFMLQIHSQARLLFLHFKLKSYEIVFIFHLPRAIAVRRAEGPSTAGRDTHSILHLILLNYNSTTTA